MNPPGVLLLIILWSWKRDHVGVTAADPEFVSPSSLHNIIGRNSSDGNTKDLVTFLLSFTSAPHIYLVYDDTTQGIDGAVSACVKAGVAVTLLPTNLPTLHNPASPTPTLLGRVLAWGNHSRPPKTVLTLCQPKTLNNILNEVKKYRLESTKVQWVVVAKDDITTAVARILREGTHMLLVHRVTSQEAVLYTSRVHVDNTIRFELMGKWSSDKNRVSGLSGSIEQSYEDFYGRELAVTTNNNWPFMKIFEPGNGTVIGVSGIDLSVVKTLSKKLNFTYYLTRPPDGKWGGPQPDGTIPGLVGQIARHEAHFTLCELTITQLRETVVDFTVPYYMESTTLVSNAPQEKNRAFAVFSPFTIQVWLCLCIVTAGVGPLLRLIIRLMIKLYNFPDNDNYTANNLSFNLYRNLMVQGNLIRPTSWIVRLVFFTWYLFCFYVYALYSGTLTAVLAVPAYEEPVDSLTDVAGAHSRGYTIATTRDSSFEEAFKEAKKGIYYDVYQLFNHKDRNLSFLPTPAHGFESILKDKYVFINAQLNSLLKASQHGLSKFYIARQTFMPQGYGIACPTGSPYQPVFSSLLRRISEAGLVYKWAQDEVNKVAAEKGGSDHIKLTAISITHLQAAFFILGLGFGLASMALCGEVLVRQWVLKADKVHDHVQSWGTILDTNTQRVLRHINF